MFNNCGSFIEGIKEIHKTQVDNAKDLSEANVWFNITAIMLKNIKNVLEVLQR